MRCDGIASCSRKHGSAAAPPSAESCHVLIRWRDACSPPTDTPWPARSIRVHSTVELCNLEVLVARVCDENRARTEQQRRPPSHQERHVGRERKHRRRETRHRVQRDRGTRSISSDVTNRVERPDRRREFLPAGRPCGTAPPPTRAEKSRLARRHPRSARPCSRSTQHRGCVGSAIDRSATSASISLSIADSPCSGVAECAARPSARNSAAARRAWPVPSRLSVGSPLIRNRAPGGVVFADRGAIAAALLADDEQQADPPSRRSRAAAPPPPPVPRECPSRRTRRGRRAARSRRGSEKTAARSRSASRTPPTGAIDASQTCSRAALDRLLDDGVAESRSSPASQRPPPLPGRSSNQY